MGWRPIVFTALLTFGSVAHSSAGYGSEGPPLARGPTRPQVTGRSLLVINASTQSVDLLTVLADNRQLDFRPRIRPGRSARIPLPRFRSCRVVYQIVLSRTPPASSELDLCRTNTIRVVDDPALN